MQLTDFQKRIIKEIAAGKIFDIYSFVSAIPVGVWGGQPYRIIEIAEDYEATQNTPITKVMDEEEALTQFKEFVALWDFLEHPVCERRFAEC